MLRFVLTLTLAISLALPATAQSARQVLNGIRSEAGLNQLRPSAALERAAMAHARDLARRGSYTHVGSDGSKVGDRARRAGFNYCRIAENIAWGQTSVRQAFQSWLNSPPHRAALLKRNVREFGLARAPGDIWVLVIGQARKGRC